MIIKFVPGLGFVPVRPNGLGVRAMGPAIMAPVAPIGTRSPAAKVVITEDSSNRFVACVSPCAEWLLSEQARPGGPRPGAWERYSACIKRCAFAEWGADWFSGAVAWMKWYEKWGGWGGTSGLGIRVSVAPSRGAQELPPGLPAMVQAAVRQRGPVMARKNVKCQKSVDPFTSTRTVPVNISCDAVKDNQFAVVRRFHAQRCCTAAGYTGGDYIAPPKR